MFGPLKTIMVMYDQNLSLSVFHILRLGYGSLGLTTSVL